MRGKATIILPARNEAENLDYLLPELQESLKDDARIIVAENYSTDDTVGVCNKYGVEIFESSIEGKLGATQEVIRSMGSAALNPILYLDSDSRLIDTNKWFKQMTDPLEACEKGMSRVVMGGAKMVDINNRPKFSYDTSFRPLTAELASWGSLGKKIMEMGMYSGPNMSFVLNEEAYQDFLDIPSNIWPSEEYVIRETITQYGDKIYLKGKNQRESTVLNPLRRKSQNSILPYSKEDFNKDYRKDMKNPDDWMNGIDYWKSKSE